MLRIFVDSGSSIKQEEKEQCGVEILPLHITLGDKEYLDGIDLSMDIFYKALMWLSALISPIQDVVIGEVYWTS